jgi:long-chain fatty acid transport protein
MNHPHRVPARQRRLPPPCTAALLTLAATLATSAHATNGYFPHGFGIKAKGMGGASIAMASDGFAGVNNPAAAAYAGSRLEVGGDVFMPRRDMSRTGFPMPGMLNTAQDSGRTAFLIPEFGYNAQVSDRLGVGLSVYGNGGMNTRYPGGHTTCGNPQTGQPMPSMNPMCGMGKLGVDLMQLIVAPTVAYKVTPQHSVGVSPLLVYQRFQAYGLQGFAPNSVNPAALTNNGTDSSTGLGVRLGYMGQLTDTVTVGLAYSPKIGMGKLKKYAGLFADGGDFDIPENHGAGVAVQVSPTVKVAVDYTRIHYSKVAAIGNASTAGALGAAGGGGFGWRDVKTLKLGVEWQMNAKTTLRFGFNRGTNPVTAANITPNILAPGVMQSHFTLGGTYALSPQSELSWAFMHAPSVSVTGPSMFNAMMGTGALIQETVRMRQNSLAIQYGWKF